MDNKATYCTFRCLLPVCFGINGFRQGMQRVMVMGLDMVTFGVAGAAAFSGLHPFYQEWTCTRQGISSWYSSPVYSDWFVNQCCYAYRTSITSPVNASIVTHRRLSSMILICHHSSRTGNQQKRCWVYLLGAVMLILTSAAGQVIKWGYLRWPALYGSSGIVLVISYSFQ